MSDPTGLRDDRHKQHAAESSLDGDWGAVSRHVHCRLAVGSGPGFTDEMSCLLRTRLRLGILVMLVGFALHFLRHALQPDPAYDQRPGWLVFRACEIAVMAIGSGLLWSRLPLSMGKLRTLELVLFGSIAAFFGWLQVE